MSITAGLSLLLLGSQAAPVDGAQGGPAPAERVAPPVLEIALPVELDERYLGDIPVRVEGDSVSFPADRLIELLSPDLTAPAIAELKSRVANGRLTPALASTSAITVAYDPALQEVRVTTPLSARQRRVISGQGRESPRQGEVIPPGGLSAFLNTSLVYSQVWESHDEDDRGRRPLSGTLDLGGRIGGNGGVAFISRHSFEEGAEHPFLRNETQLIYDDVDRLLRVTAGDLRFRGSGFQGVPRIAGISVERLYGRQPTLNFRPVAQTQFELERPSTVDVMINGVLLRQLFLQPGRYDLRDLPIGQGSNNVELVIRDDTGRQQIISSSAFFDFDLLAEGMSDFSFAAGVRSRFDDGLLHYGDEYVVSGFYRRGLSPELTAGVDAQLDQSGGTLGTGGVWASPIGIWRLQAAASKRDGFGNGYAVDLGYGMTGRFGEGLWNWSLDANAQYLSPNFTTIADYLFEPGTDDIQPFAGSVSANFNLNGPKWSMSATGQYNKGRGDQGDTASALIGGNYNVGRSLSVGAFGTYTRTGSLSDVGVLFQVSYRPGRNRSVRATYDTARGQMDLNYRYSAPPYVGRTTYEVGITRNTDRDDANLRALLFHTGNRFEAFAQHDVFGTANFGERVQVSRAALSSSLVLADGKISVARPVREAFAIVSPHESLEDREIRLNPTEEGYRARTDWIGSAVAPDLTTYDEASIYYDVKDLPPGYDLGSGQFTLRPPLFAGYDLTVGSGASFTLIGRVLQGGEPLALVGGKLIALDDPEAEPIPAFTNRNGRLAATGLRAGRYRLELNTTPVFTTEIVIDEDAPSLVEVGEIRIPEE